jgi:hypothetical protein
MVKSNKFLQTYKNLNLVIYSCKIGWDKKNNKKILHNFPKQDIKEMRNYNHDYIDENKNGYLMKMGEKLQDENILVGLDIDNKEDHIETINKKDIEVKNGLTKWIEILNNNNIDNIESLDTCIQKTGNNGYHYLFKLNNNDYSKLKTINGLYINEIKYSIDFKAKNQALIVEPSYYYNDKKELKEYKWIKSPEKQSIQYMPLFVYNMLLNSKAPVIKREKIESLNINIDTNGDEWLAFKIELLNNLNPDRFHNGNNWRFMARLFNNLSLSVDLFNEYSKTSSKYESFNDCYKQYKKYDNDNKYNLKTLIYMSTKDDIKKCNEILKKYHHLNQEYNLQKLQNIEDKYKKIIIDDRYLLSQNINWNKEENELTRQTDKFMTDDNIKSLNIKSPYDTGKTQLLIKLITFDMLNQ